MLFVPTAASASFASCRAYRWALPKSETCRAPHPLEVPGQRLTRSTGLTVHTIPLRVGDAGGLGRISFRRRSKDPTILGRSSPAPIAAPVRVDLPSIAIRARTTCRITRALVLRRMLNTCRPLGAPSIWSLHLMIQPLADSGNHNILWSSLASGTVDSGQSATLLNPGPTPTLATPPTAQPGYVAHE